MFVNGRHPGKTLSLRGESKLEPSIVETVTSLLFLHEYRPGDNQSRP